ncbi:DUF1150 domain-containing protein [Thalassococcus sp. CAU 1522]|uniref:DUF1150 domain-containing protein n=1 Tax=Thalassococcus arenae TaxID=2851652 RepID=A0ABS6N6W4_9RHOB|nr:DUF1150 family protein [Thalassococcus arenae]MBV2359755.1 DUF1150 domain-containing protein [Thalassococcus arenae]
MHTKYDLSQFDDDRIVYVRSVAAKDLPQDVQAQLGGVKTLYAVHNADGERLALVKDRRLAFMLARQHDMAPVTVH